MNWLKVTWIVLLALYIISPWDLQFSLIDDFIALIVLLWIIFIYKRKKSKPMNKGFGKVNQQTGNDEINLLKKAYATFGLSPQATYQELKAVYEKRLADNKKDEINCKSEEMRDHISRFEKVINEDYRLICKAKGYEV